MEDVTARFAEVVAQPSDVLALDEAVLLIAAHDHPVDLEWEFRHLDFYAGACQDEASLDRVRRVLFVHLGFRGAPQGDHFEYHHPDNSFLDRVMDRQQGLPILLCIFTAEVAARVGVCLAPVGMPGHFLLRDCSDEDVFVDPYHGGALLGPDDCKALYEGLGIGLPFHEEMLEPVDNHTVLARVLTNLARAFHSRGDLTSLGWVLHLRALAAGGDAWTQSAIIQERIGNWARAAEAWDNLNEPVKAIRARAQGN